MIFICNYSYFICFVEKDHIFPTSKVVLNATLCIREPSQNIKTLVFSPDYLNLDLFSLPVLCKPLNSKLSGQSYQASIVSCGQFRCMFPSPKIGCQA